jgi:proline dehydrogenase
VLRRVLLALSEDDGAKGLVRIVPGTRRLVQRFVAGESAADALAAAARLADAGLRSSLDLLGEDTLYRDRAAATRDAYLRLIAALDTAGLAGSTEVSVKLSAIGQFLPRDGEKIALEHALAVCAAADRAGTSVTLDMEDHTATDSTLAIARELRADFPSAGVVMLAHLRRSEGDCRDLVGAGTRVRLVKGGYAEPEWVAFSERHEIDLSYVRCLRVLMGGQGIPMIATHDPRLIAVAQGLAARYDRPLGSYEYQLMYGIRPEEQQRLAAAGETVRVRVPYGEQWYAAFMRRLAERPSANLTHVLRSVASRD